MSTIQKTTTSKLVMLALDIDQSQGGKYMFPSEKPTNSIIHYANVYLNSITIFMLPDCTLIRSVSDEVVKHFRHNLLRDFILGNRDLVDFVFGKTFSEKRSNSMLPEYLKVVIALGTTGLPQLACSMRCLLGSSLLGPIREAGFLCTLHTWVAWFSVEDHSRYQVQHTRHLCVFPKLKIQ